jgi:hypothetical protein
VYVRARTYCRDRHSEMPVVYMFTMFVSVLVRVLPSLHLPHADQTVVMGQKRTPAEAHLLVRCTCSTVPKTVMWGYSFAARTRCKNNLPHGRAFFWDRRSYSPTLNTPKWVPFNLAMHIFNIEITD